MSLENIHSDDECLELLQKILDGYAAFLKKYLPIGWKKSECINFFHSTAQQQYDEHKIISENIKQLSKKKEEEKEVHLSDFEQDLSDVDEKKEPLTLLGLCLWDIFSDNHSVVDLKGVEYDLGSFRGSAQVIAEFINGKPNNSNTYFDYVEFYMGTIWIRKRTNVQPFYEYIFTVLKKEHCDWKYSFPRMGLVNFKSDKPVKPQEYNPEKAMEQELENKKVDEFQKELDNIYEEEFENAIYKTPPKTVLAYQNIYGDLPDGHPQKRL